MVLWLFDWWLPLNLSEQLFYCKLRLIVGGGDPYFLHELCISEEKIINPLMHDVLKWSDTL